MPHIVFFFRESYRPAPSLVNSRHGARAVADYRRLRQRVRRDLEVARTRFIRPNPT